MMGHSGENQEDFLMGKVQRYAMLSGMLSLATKRMKTTATPSSITTTTKSTIMKTTIASGAGRNS